MLLTCSALLPRNKIKARILRRRCYLPSLFWRRFHRAKFHSKKLSEREISYNEFTSITRARINEKKTKQLALSALILRLKLTHSNRYFLISSRIRSLNFSQQSSNSLTFQFLIFDRVPNDFKISAENEFIVNIYCQQLCSKY